MAFFLIVVSVSLIFTVATPQKATTKSGETPSEGKLFRKLTVYSDMYS